MSGIDQQSTATMQSISASLQSVNNLMTSTASIKCTTDYVPGTAKDSQSKHTESKDEKMLSDSEQLDKVSVTMSPDHQCLANVIDCLVDDNFTG